MSLTIRAIFSGPEIRFVISGVPGRVDCIWDSFTRSPFQHPASSSEPKELIRSLLDGPSVINTLEFNCRVSIIVGPLELSFLLYLRFFGGDASPSFGTFFPIDRFLFGAMLPATYVCTYILKISSYLLLRWKVIQVVTTQYNTKDIYRYLFYSNSLGSTWFQGDDFRVLDCPGSFWCWVVIPLLRLIPRSLDPSRISPTLP